MPSSAVGPAGQSARAMALFLLTALGLTVGYAAVATVLWINRDFADRGPLSVTAPPAITTLDAARSLGPILQRCQRAAGIDRGDDSTKIVAARVDGVAYYACYHVERDGRVSAAAVVDGRGVRAPDKVIKKAGAWRWIGTVKTPDELLAAGAALATLLILYVFYYIVVRPGAPVPSRWWQRTTGNAVLGVLLVLPFTLPFRRGESRARRIRLLYQFVFGISGTALAAGLKNGWPDRLSSVTFGWLLAGMVFGWLGGRTLLRPAGFGRPDTVDVTPPAPPGEPGLRTAADPAVDVRAVRAAPATAGRGARAEAVRVEAPGDLPTFADVGGMDSLKAELADTVGTLLAFTGEADVYRISFNGILLHGPPGVGKTFVARATAGEFGLNLVQVTGGELMSKYLGESADNVRAVFAHAARHVPCLLFFDEFDSIAERRDGSVNEENRRVVSQLLRSLEEWHPVHDLVIMAATNRLEDLDRSIVRPGRFDRHIRVDLPDLDARRAVLAAQLAGRPVAADLDLDQIARRTAGRTPATIVRVVQAAALEAFRAATGSGVPVPITTRHLEAALAGLGGTDRPTVEDWTWDRLILAEDVKSELRQIQTMIAHPERARQYGVEVPSGLLLAGPPGTGKTTIARVLAAQAGCSFYPRTAADLTSKWVGESEASVVRLFARARDNAPSIIFIDEIDAVAGARSDTGSTYADRTLTQLLAEMDGMTDQHGVFVMAATNRPDLLDPALLRGGRLSRTVTIPLPDTDDRRALLALFTATMPLHEVDLGLLAGWTDGFSGADLEALCQHAALRAMVAAQRSGATGGPPAVSMTAFTEALREHSRPGGTTGATRIDADSTDQDGAYL